MQPDVLTYNRFYQRPLGAAAASIVGDMVMRHTPHVSGKRVVGLGYSLPYLERLMAEGALPVAFMPARQGVCHWPDSASPLSALVDVYDLPLADSSVDMVIAVHALEHANRPAAFLREIWRVLVPGGKVMIIVPNRRRMWAALEATPFGHGRPYSKGQLYTLMEDQMLSPLGWSTALMQPPCGIKLFAKSMRFVETPVRILGKNLGGALMVHADKQMYGTVVKSRRVPRTVPVVMGP
ncbi:methyltransferase type 11 [Kordiimonas sediminis]|uniref:Methyltransferase type 11 n=1 Tax=Kordiimonas sediminis TaxID=1735581 RepID=A0A919AIR8_9PROT|nr:class I SAM-dependent methyltransferase [Kordiimonas sediminis]GHF11784.1 methyltransferase type 11 [Kordiimonas sediminis]